MRGYIFYNFVSSHQLLELLLHLVLFYYSLIIGMGQSNADVTLLHSLSPSFPQFLIRLCPSMAKCLPPHSEAMYLSALPLLAKVIPPSPFLLSPCFFFPVKVAILFLFFVSVQARVVFFFSNEIVERKMNSYEL